MNNFIKELQNTKHYKNFTDWWHKKYENKLGIYVLYEDKTIYADFIDWASFPFEMQKGVFEGYFEQIKWRLMQDYDGKYCIFLIQNRTLLETELKDFQDLVLFAFNQ